jgi:hypothetical protein
MRRRILRFADVAGLWLSLAGCLLFACVGVYGALKAETPGDLAMASLAIPLFGWCAFVMAGSLRERHRRTLP